MDSIRRISKFWDSDITESIIKNCFKSCEFFNSIEPTAEVTHEWDPNPFEDFDDINWMELKDFMTIGENIQS